MAGHLPKVTPSFFAEFLKPLFPIRLGILAPAHLCRFAVRKEKALSANLFLEAEKSQIAIALRRKLLFITQLNVLADLPAKTIL